VRAPNLSVLAILGYRPRVLGALDRKLHALVLAHAEHNAPEAVAGGQVHVQDALLAAAQTLHGPLDEFLATRCEDLQVYVLDARYQLPAVSLVLSEHASEVEICLGCAGERDLDLLVSNLNQHLEEAEFLFAVHGVNEGLVAISQVRG